MRIDRLTSKLQLALSDAQSLAVGHDHPAIEPAHLMQAMLEQQGGSIKPLLMQVGFDVNSLRKELTKICNQKASSSVMSISTMRAAWRRCKKHGPRYG
jgi:ATP-dependent Clp protease ATP-binding subunit ClpB